ncbi:hypothetical protein ES707_20928 [subsurface metagenome]
MVEIRYGENYEMADLAGKSIAQAREQYKQEFGIPDKAQASLNSKGIRQKHELVTALGDNDSLTFAQKSRKGLFFIGAILLALAVTGGVFAYGALTYTVTGAVTAESSEFADAAAGINTPTWSLWGKYTGQIPATTEVFEVTPGNQFTGDFVIQIYLTNVDDLVEVYRVMGMRWTVTNDTLNTGITGVTCTPTTGFLSLTHPTIDLEIQIAGTPNGIEKIDVDLSGGFFRTQSYGTGWGGDEDPQILCKIIQKGT